MGQNLPLLFTITSLLMKAVLGFGTRKGSAIIGFMIT
jgi:hypothetical protein